MAEHITLLLKQKGFCDPATSGSGQSDVRCIRVYLQNETAANDPPPGHGEIAVRRMARQASNLVPGAKSAGDLGWQWLRQLCAVGGEMAFPAQGYKILQGLFPRFTPRRATQGMHFQ